MQRQPPECAVRQCLCAVRERARGPGVVIQSCSRRHKLRRRQRVAGLFFPLSLRL